MSDSNYNKYIDSVFNDFFGPGSGGDGKPPVFDDPKKENEIKKQVNEDFEKIKEGKDITGPKMDNNISLGQDNDTPQIENKADENANAGKDYHSADEALNEAKALFNNISHQ